jgi:hypothetical protein
MLAILKILSIITEIDDAIEKLKQVYKVDIIQFSDNQTH